MSSTSGDSLQIVNRLKQAIWDRRPVLGDIMHKHGEDTLYRYSQDFMDVNKSPLLDSLKNELIETVENLVGERLGCDVAKGVAKQLAKVPLVSTADHHGPIDHPFWVNANIISAIPYLENKDPDVKYLVVFSFASVSVNNASAYPRGILFHGGMNGSGNLVRLPILPDKEKMAVVYAAKPYTKELLEKAEDDVHRKEKNGEITHERAHQVADVLREYFWTDDVLNDTDLCSQITKINYKMWPKLFHPKKDESPSAVRPPDLIYLEIERLVAELLTKFHLNRESSIIYRLLFGESYRTLIKKYFNNLPGGFSLENGWGTYMFWGLDDKKHRVQMFFDGKFLHSKERTIEVPFTPEGIATALKNKTIFPSMLLCYLVVPLYYGMKCLGGFCQVHDLTVLKEAWGKLLVEIGEKEEAEATLPVQTKELGGDGMVLSYLPTQKGDLVPATGIDMILEDTNTEFETFAKMSKQLCLSEIMNPMLPEMYTVLYTAEQREPELLSITPEKIMKDLGLEEKIAHMNNPS